jgi:hypothetical protein
MDAPDKRRVPKWVWQALALCVVAAVVAMCSLLRSPPPAKPTAFVSNDGRMFRILEQREWSENGQPPSFEVGMPVDPGTSQDDVRSQADRLFEALVGPKAELLGYKRALIRPDDGSQKGWVSVEVHVGTGDIDADAFRGAVAYDRSPDGLWTRGGAALDPPPHIEEYRLPSGARFALASAFEDNAQGTFVYDCLSCDGADAETVFTDNLTGLLRSVAVVRAERDKLAAARVVVFSRNRRTIWDFSEPINLNIQRGADGAWRGPDVSPQLIEAKLVAYRKKMRDLGAAQRGESK